MHGGRTPSPEGELSFEPSVAELVKRAEEMGTTLGHVVLLDESRETGESESVLLARMGRRLRVMRDSVRQGLQGERSSRGGMVRGDARRYADFTGQKSSLLGPALSRAVAGALAAAEANATMGRICAAPTAGSCGVLPGVVLALEQLAGVEDTDLVGGLFTAAGIGIVIASRATLSGAEAGCQAECGAAAGMAAAAAVEIMGGTPSQAAHATALTLKASLGLVCDPVAGLVEAPCIKRNAMAAVQALAAADLALGGVESVIPCDEVIDAMAQVGRLLPTALKETAQAGIADTPTAWVISRRIERESAEREESD